MSISHWGMFFGYHVAEPSLTGNGYHAVYRIMAHPDDMPGAW